MREKQNISGDCTGYGRAMGLIIYTTITLGCSEYGITWVAYDYKNLQEEEK